ncbi:MAG: pyruvate kinase [Polyangiaceae bacterium]|nr:pyruvate kinase [Polyangiaceae bacterium]
MAPRRAKIVCTLGPAVDSDDAVLALARAGMDVARLNFSHGDPRDHVERVRRVREASRSVGRPIAVLQDLAGPKLRTASEGFPPGLVTGETVDLVAGTRGSSEVIAVDYPTLAQDVQPGDAVLLADGHVALRVRALRGDRVHCDVEHGGALRARMGVALPSARVRGGALTEKDRRDVALGLELGVDWLALSFVRRPTDLDELRALLDGAAHPPAIVAKIETAQAVAHLDAIVAAADASMVARGDLGVELPPETLPGVQKTILGACRAHQRPAIVATEMLQSMVTSPRPTRAEASDVAGAVFDGADAVMLSAETATGAHPIDACATMDRIVREAEASRFYGPPASVPDGTVPEAVAESACQLARTVRARVIVALTTSGDTARLVSKARPPVPILALSQQPRTLARLALAWGILPRPLELLRDADEMSRRAAVLLQEHGLAGPGDRFVLVYGGPLGQRGATNALRVEVVP